MAVKDKSTLQSDTTAVIRIGGVPSKINATELRTLVGDVIDSMALTGDALPGAGTLPVSYAQPLVYGTPDAPVSGGITEDLAGAVPGVGVTVLHTASSAPTLPATWHPQTGGQAYVPDALNFLDAQYMGTLGGTAYVRYTISQYT